MALQSIINRFGSDVIAAFTATSRIEQLVQQPYNSLATALATFAAQNIGAGNQERVRRGFRKSTFLVIVFSVIMCGIMFLSGEAFVRLFVKDANVIAIGGRAIRITESVLHSAWDDLYYAQPFESGRGDSAFAFVSGLAEVVGRVGFSILLAGIPALGYWASLVYDRSDPGSSQEPPVYCAICRKVGTDCAGREIARGGNI
ncbi:MAG: MATE family efflux transporter [Lachnospiraceae bacterium]